MRRPVSAVPEDAEGAGRLLESRSDSAPRGMIAALPREGTEFGLQLQSFSWVRTPFGVECAGRRPLHRRQSTISAGCVREQPCGTAGVGRLHWRQAQLAGGAIIRGRIILQGPEERGTVLVSAGE